MGVWLFKNTYISVMLIFINDRSKKEPFLSWYERWCSDPEIGDDLKFQVSYGCILTANCRILFTYILHVNVLRKKGGFKSNRAAAFELHLLCRLEAMFKGFRKSRERRAFDGNTPLHNCSQLLFLTHRYLVDKADPWSHMAAGHNLVFLFRQPEIY